MHVYFSGIGGAGICPLSIVAYQAGFDVSGSDKQSSDYIDYLLKSGIENIHIGQSKEDIAAVHHEKPIEWMVISSAVLKENKTHPEIEFAKTKNIRISKRDEFIVEFLNKTNHEMIAIAGTHGKTTTTAMTVWAFKQLGIPVSYALPAKTTFSEMGSFDKNAKYFIYEADEYDKNFLSYSPRLSLISGVAYDHPDIYPTVDEYKAAFRQFLDQSKRAFLWEEDAEFIGVQSSLTLAAIVKEDYEPFADKLIGPVNRDNARLVIQGIFSLDETLDFQELSDIMNDFPGLSRRFEKLAPNIYSDYAHTPEKIRGALQTAKETSDSVVVVYEGLHNTRQHFIHEQLKDLFTGAKQLYVVPSYLAREDESLEMLTPEKLCEIIQQPSDRIPSELNEELLGAIKAHADSGDLVLCLSAGGGGCLDEWLRKQLT